MGADWCRLLQNEYVRTAEHPVRKLGVVTLYVKYSWCSLFVANAFGAGPPKAINCSLT